MPVNPNASAATVNAIRPRASVSVVDLALGVTVQIPVAAIDHIVLQATAVLDVRGLHRKTFDSFVVLDAVAIELVKPFAEAVAISDALLGLAVTKPLSDSFTATDSAPLITFAKGLADSFTATDSGSLLCQSYVDPTYLASDYVGSSRSF